MLPLVRTQVESQIKVRDLSKATVSIQPAEFPSWDAARSALITEAKRGPKSQMEAEIAEAVDDEARGKIRAAFLKREKQIEHTIDHQPMDVHMALNVAYNFLSK